MDLPPLTHAELLRQIQTEIAQAGSQAAAARLWGISYQLLSLILTGERNVGPKLLRALKLRRVTLIVHRYAPEDGQPTCQTVRKRSRGTEQRRPD